MSFHQRNVHQQAKPTHGFTLIELLVVISIIALLISILLPALSSARESGRASVCASNLHQVAIAMPMYADEYDGYLPPYTIADAGGSYTDPTTGTTYNQFRKYLLLSTWFKSGNNADPPRSGDGFLRPYMGSAKNQLSGILGCPSVPQGPVFETAAEVGGGSTAVQNFRDRSYVFNLAATVGTPSYAARKLDDIKSQSNFFAVSDGSGAAVYTYPPPGTLWADGTAMFNYTVETVTIGVPFERHNDSFNALFMDGHVSRGDLKTLFIRRYFEQ